MKRKELKFYKKLYKNIDKLTKEKSIKFSILCNIYDILDADNKPNTKTLLFKQKIHADAKKLTKDVLEGLPLTKEHQKFKTLIESFDRNDPFDKTIEKLQEVDPDFMKGWSKDDTGQAKHKKN